MTIFRIFLSITFVVLANIFTFAQIITDRPDQSESSAIVTSGALQIESGVSLSYTTIDVIANRVFSIPNNLIRYGLTTGLEFRLFNQVELNKLGDRSRQGISDLQVGFKVSLLNDPEKNAQIAFLSHLSMPSGNELTSTNSYGTINKLIFSHSLNDKLSIGYNLGHSYFGQGSGDLLYTFSLWRKINNKVSCFVEPYGTISEFEDLAASIDAGFVYLLNNNLQFDFSFGTGINQNMNFMSMGVSWLMNGENDK